LSLANSTSCNRPCPLRYRTSCLQFYCLQHGRVILDIQLVPCKILHVSIFIVAVIMSPTFTFVLSSSIIHRNLEALKVQALLSLSVWDLPMSLSVQALLSALHPALLLLPLFPRLYYAIPFDVLAIPVEHVCSFYCSGIAVVSSNLIAVLPAFSTLKPIFPIIPVSSATPVSLYLVRFEYASAKFIITCSYIIRYRSRLSIIVTLQNSTSCNRHVLSLSHFLSPVLLPPTWSGHT